MHKSLRLAMIGLLLLFLIQGAGIAGAPTDPVKYSQLPNMTAQSWDYSSEVKPDTQPTLWSLMADDWKCPDGRPVTDIHWWGSYWVPNGAYSVYSDWLTNAPAGGITGFNFTIYDDIPVDPSQGIVFSRPGAVKKSFTIQGNANEVLHGTIDKGSGLTEDVYQYYVKLPENDWFYQEKDKIYWLSIQAVLPTNAKQWGWHEADGHWIDYSVQKWGSESGWYVACTGHDMAFELTTIPEPASLFALGTGMLALGGMVLRGRRRTP